MDRDYKKAANITVIILGAIAFAYLLFKYALYAVIPFVLAAVLGAVISPASDRLAKKTKIPKKIISVFLILLIFAAISLFVFFVISHLVREISDLLSRLESDPDTVSDFISGIGSSLSSFGERFGFLRGILESEVGVDVNMLLENSLRSILSSLSGAIPSLAVGFVSKIPSALLFIAVFIISTFYFATDEGSISKGMTSFLPDRWQEKLPTVKAKLKTTLVGYLKAYLLIMLLTFTEVFLGLSILRVKYAFLAAILIAIVDILPILGTGTVLVPWAVISYISKDPRTGTGLLILYAITLIVRQLSEPKLVGDNIGLHPLATLASVYIGIVTIGFSGIFIGPMVALLLKNALK